MFVHPPDTVHTSHGCHLTKADAVLTRHGCHLTKADTLHGFMMPGLIAAGAESTVFHTHLHPAPCTQAPSANTSGTRSNVPHSLFNAMPTPHRR
eukprot:365506-Chlamydomonas_euryale.AAC.2